jgi:hypothetical protein
VLETPPESHPLGEAVLRPLVEARLIGARGREGQRVAALVDSGSNWTLAFDWMAQEIGVELNENRSHTLRIAGAPRTVLFADAGIRLCPPGAPTGGPAPCDRASGLEWTTEVGFIRNWADPPWLMVLGQAGFFDQFTVVMSRLSQALAIEERDDFDQRYGMLIAPEA